MTTDIAITFIAAQQGDECGMCDCIPASLLDRDIAQHYACFCGQLAHRRVTIKHGCRTERLPVCGHCTTRLMDAITHAVTPDPAPVKFGEEHPSDTHREEAAKLLEKLAPDLEALADHLGHARMIGLAVDVENLTKPYLLERVRTFIDPDSRRHSGWDDEPPF
ncbi:MAG: hypothetical protein O2892_19260 [Actinomycetota bacterium]|nr:hypothetical protein [Actinomycetota bacterium]MDA2951143.1 hypothetical protein [Actinomycetota bacterium]